MKEISPPAIVRQADDLDTLAQSINAVDEACARYQRLSEEKAEERKALLRKAKELCARAGVPWHKWIEEKLKLSIRRVQEIIKDNDCPPRAEIAHGAPDESEKTEPPDILPIPDFGPPKQSRAERVGQKPPTPFEVKEREPGDDTEAEAKERKREKEARQSNGQPVFQIKEMETHFGPLVRDIDALGKAYGAKESAEAEKLRSLLREFLDGFKAWHKALTKGAK